MLFLSVEGLVLTEGEAGPTFPSPAVGSAGICHVTLGACLHLGADLLKMSRDDLVQVCGPADGIRLFNAIKGR